MSQAQECSNDVQSSFTCTLSKRFHSLLHLRIKIAFVRFAFGRLKCSGYHFRKLDYILQRAEKELKVAGKGGNGGKQVRTGTVIDTAGAVHCTISFFLGESLQDGRAVAALLRWK